MTTMIMTPDHLLAAVDRAARKYIPTKRDQDFRLQLDRLFARDASGIAIATPRKDAGTGDAKGLAVIEAAGGGKSSLIEQGLSRHPLLQPKHDDHRPWLKVLAPSPATTKSLGIAILLASGYEDVSRRNSEQEIWQMVRHRLQLLGVVFLWIDEAHDLFGSAAPVQVQDTQKALKNIMQGRGAVSVILSGIDTLWALTSCDEQVNRRYAKMPLASISAVADEKLLSQIVRVLCAEVGMSAPVGADLLGRLVHASRGRFGRFIENILAALEVAAQDCASDLEMRHFATAWARQEGCVMGGNVFLAKNWAQIDLGQNKVASQKGGR
ncbi:TniB family NTP-binding protein [Seohaeicola sp. SP36]|uniref:TniB family NTP-binding protein n=1 Tax=unclassified Seohaeicola TaxID=2641111 RepID=UPI00237A6D4F|nr:MULTISPECIES: TniB family NTP-binding protein [unclassified Seohaeicola]MDD9707308.1 TniB family NTP-binding protein [Seohaeicola sp. 4SK31]MDD9735717.1 TniB family NTP-binding protein [Seohaeicola sp. SP36]